jgi:ABC-type phosphate transport system auxiliary subunit
VTEGKKKLAETQKRFVSEAAKKVEGAINETLKREMSQLHEDLERNRQNMFGRRIFEAVAAEFMTSYLAEGTEIRKLQNVLETKEKELAETTAEA